MRRFLCLRRLTTCCGYLLHTGEHTGARRPGEVAFLDLQVMLACGLFFIAQSFIYDMQWKARFQFRLPAVATVLEEARSLVSDTGTLEDPVRLSPEVCVFVHPREDSVVIV